MTAGSLNIGGFIKTLLALAMQALAGTTAADGAAINRQGYYSCVVSAQTGASTGSPSSYSHTFSVQHSDDGATNWATYTDPEGNASFTITADNTENHVAIDLSGAKQYIRIVATPAFTGGTSPTTYASATVVLGGADTLPAA